MNKEQLIKKYQEIYKKMEAYEYATSIVYFDNTTRAPKKSLEEKAELDGILAMELYNLATNKETIDVINKLYDIKESLIGDMKRIIELAKKDLDHIQKIPPKLYQELNVLGSKTYLYWLEAKEKSDFKIVAPYLKRLIEIKKKIAKYYGEIDGSLYNVWLDIYEEGMTTKQLDNFFSQLKARIVPLLERIKHSKVKINDDFASAKVSKDKQLSVSEYILKTIGFDLTKGLIAETEHPYTMKVTTNDIRITTHIYENMFFSNIFSTVHEGGHALYDQNLDESLIGTSLRDGTSMAIHESQSRLYENIIGRSKEFISLIHKKIVGKLPSEYKDITEEDMYLAANKVESSLIRTEADELTYCLHIMIRYEIEKVLFDGDINIDELPDLWNRLYKEYLGIDVPSDSKGILQDSHWYGGSFGYFPSYALGNVYSAQFVHIMGNEIDFFGSIKNNKIKNINKWLKENVYRYGKRIYPNELMKIVTGEELNCEYYLDYLENKFKSIYELD